ncbi:MAG: MlaD family protein [Fulvivirga sp.]
MNKNIRKDITLGIFITVGILLLAGAIYYVGSQQQLFSKSVHISALFKNVGGLQSGNNVRFSGIKVGIVENIEIATDSTARVILRISEDARKFIKEDAFATIESDGLMGNKIVSISLGSPGARSLKEGDQIRTREPVNLDDVISSFMETSDNARKLTGNLNEISKQIRSAEGLLGKIVSDSILAQRVANIVVSLERTGRNAAEITHQIEEASKKLNTGGGLLARSIHDEALGRAVEQTIDSLNYSGRNLASASRDLKKFMQALNNNPGLLNKLLNDSIAAKNLEETLRNVRQGTEDMDKVMTTLNNSWLLNLFSGNRGNKKDSLEK